MKKFWWIYKVVYIYRNLKENKEKGYVEISEEKGLKNAHFSKGMQCMNCDIAREISGNGKEYVSLIKPGAMNTKCENCH